MQGLISRPKRLLVGLILVLAVVHFAGIAVRGPRARLVRGDAVHYYVWIRSLVFDGDLDFRNDYDGFYALEAKAAGKPLGATEDYPQTSTGLVRNVMAVGTPLLWSPLFVAVAAVHWAASAVGLAPPPDGYEVIFQLVPDVVGLAAVGGALWFVFLLGRGLFGDRAAVTGAVATLLGGSLLYYTAVAPSYSHAVSALASAGFFWYWWKSQDDQSVVRYAKLGAVAGAVALVRWQAGILLGAALLDVVSQRRSAHAAGWGVHVRFAVSRLAAAAAGAWLVFLPQTLAWYHVYGQILLVPQGGDFMRWLAPHPLETLFSPMRGLVAWTPITALGLAGLVPLYRRSARTAVLMGVFFLVSLYINAAVVDWWAGEAFGARRFLSCFAPFAIGLAAWLAQPGGVGRAARIVTGLLVVANLLLFLHYEAFMLGARALAPYPSNWYTLWVERWAVPFRLIGAIFFKTGGA